MPTPPPKYVTGDFPLKESLEKYFWCGKIMSCGDANEQVERRIVEEVMEGLLTRVGE